MALVPALLLAAVGTVAADEGATGDRAATERMEAVLSWARAFVGIPYRIGSEGPNLFDCSGLVYRAFEQAGQLPRVGGARLRAAGYQRWFAQRAMVRASEADAQRGDLVMYGRGEHIGFYLGDGRVISALTSGVAVHSLRGITLDVTGFLAVEYSGTGGDQPIVANPADVDFLPETPAALIPAAPWMPALAEPQTASSRTERPEMRTASSRTYANDDGSFTTEFHAQPINYQAPGLDEWLPIDLSFAATGDGAATTASPAALSLGAAQAGSPFVRLTSGALAAGFTALEAPSAAGGAAEPQVSADGRYVDYVDFLPTGIGLRVFARPNGFKAFLVMPEEPASNRFSFALDAPGLTPRAEEDGSISLLDASGQVVGRLPRPLLLDSSDGDGDGGGVFTAAASISLVEGDADTAPVVTIAVDRRYLAEAVYPAYVGLTVADFPQPSAGDVTFGSSRHPNANFDAYQRPEEPAYTELWHGRQPGTQHTNEIYLRFDDLAATLDGVTIESAELRMLPYWQSTSGDVAVAAGVVAEEWQAGQLSWNARPAIADIVGGVETTAGEWAAMDVTTYLWAVLGGAPDYGLVIGAGAKPGAWLRLVAQQGADPAGIGPRLAVTWSGLRPAAAGSADWSVAPRLSWTSPALAAEQDRFRVQVSSDGFQTLVAESGTVKGDAGRLAEWSVRAERLADGQSYQWRVSVKYETDRTWSAWSDPAGFIFGAARLEPDPF